MIAQSHRRQVFLFLTAIVLPAAAAVALGARMIGQQRALAENRVAEDRRRAVAGARARFLAELDRLTSRALRADGTMPRLSLQSPVRLVAPVHDDRLLFPWDVDEAITGARRALADSAFATTIASAERAELVRRDFADAISTYRSALTSFRNEVQAAYCRMLLARALMAGGDSARAGGEYRVLLEADRETVDENGVPFSLYAAVALIEAGRETSAISDAVRAQVASAPLRSPSTVYMLRDLAAKARGTAADTVLSRTIGDAVQLMERAVALPGDLPVLRARSGDADDGWIGHGDGAWLVTVLPRARDGQEILVAIAVDDVTRIVNESFTGDGLPAAGVVAPRATTNGGEALDLSLAGLQLVFPETSGQLADQEVGLRNSFYLVVLVVVLGIALFGGYLLWRDVRREMRIAQLRTDVVSSVSHELKTPLTSIRMFVETLRSHPDAEPALQADFLETIGGETERLTRLLNNVLDLSRIEQGQKLYRREPTQLEAVVQRAARALEYPLRQDGFRLGVDVKGVAAPVSADADALEQAILNLLTNAMKYSGKSRDIELRLAYENGDAVIAVTDHGIGIPPSALGRLTQKFFRVPSPENQHIPGTGLGLTVVEHTARAHGGSLVIDSAVGQGSTFSIHLPLEGANEPDPGY